MLINIDCSIAPSEEVNSTCVDNYKEQLYIDTCASSGIFLLTLQAKFMLEFISQRNQPMALGMSDHETSIMINRVKGSGSWRNIMASTISCKRIECKMLLYAK
jgi:hypothetical protein